ncbi:MAG TPA: glycosyltransferase family 4 protein [Candidatus Binatia bacterium]|jgi:glycosyltransferase involved in cell wall biosynthesis|nr:glycosyltransferase family 4 protein [Candidatus Binatia bacterium]
MRITFVAPGPLGGGARVVTEYARGLLKRGHHARILYGRHNLRVRDALRDTYLRLRYSSRDNWLRSFPGEAVAYDKLTPELAGRNDAVIGVGANCTLSIASLPGWCGVKVHNCHGRELSNMERMRTAWELRMPRIVVASYLEREMRARGCEDEIYTVHNGVESEEYFPALPEEARSGVGTVFHGAYTKGPELILGVFQQLHQLSPSTPLMMFGSYPRPAGLPAGTKYVRLPSIAQARGLYSRAEVWFCGSRSEGFPGPVLEAMACGCALVSTDCGGSADQIQDGHSGYLVPVDDVEAMTGRILNLLREPDLRKRFRAAAQAGLSGFTWTKAIQSLETALASITAKGAPSLVGITG